MALVKHSQRTSRKGCNKCGTTEVYWAHDTDKRAKSDCGECSKRDGSNVNGAWVLIDRSGSLHSVTCMAKDAATAPVITAPKPESDPAPSAPEIPAPATAPAPSAPAAPADGVASALQALMGALSPSVDPEQLRKMIREEVESIVFPTQTVIIREKTKETVKVNGPTHYAYAEVLEWLMCGEHVLMVGPAGTGKSTIAKQAADALGIAYGAISLNPQTPKSDLFGYKDANGNYHGTVFRERCDKGGLMNLDEFDNGHGGIMAGLNMALANGYVAFPDGMVQIHDDFLCVAGANTDGRGAKDGYIRQRLDYATLDRFTVVHVGYDEKLEAELIRGTGIAKDDGVKVLTAVRQARANVQAAGMDLVYSPRASLSMARGLLGGLPWERVVSSRLRRGLTDQEWAKVGAGIAA